MSFLVEHITLKNFRSYRDETFDLSQALTIVYGDNAIGKTNLIEALQLLTQGESFRAPSWEDVHRFESEEPTVIALTAAGDGRTREVEVRVEGKTRTFMVNGKRVRSAHDINGALPSVLFIPQDLELVTGSSEQRRSELDSLGSQLSRGYRQLVLAYRRVVQQRNRLLKDEVTGPVFAVLTDQLVEYGAALFLQRLKLFVRLAPHMVDAYAQLDARDTLAPCYRASVLDKQLLESEEARAVSTLPVADLEERFRVVLAEKSPQERARMISVVGPHRDDVVFSLAGRDARVFGSQGQTRSLTLAWKLAEVALIEEITGQQPLLLLDDVMSELAARRRAALTAVVETTAQTIITTANVGYFTDGLLAQARTYHLTADETDRHTIIVDAQGGGDDAGR